MCCLGAILLKKTHYIMAGAVIASDTITLSSVSDGYSVMLTPTSCVIHADFDGSNPQLDYAYTNVSVLCGEEKVKCSIVETTDSADGLTYQTSIIDDYNAKLKITGIDTSILSGYIDLKISVPNVAKPLDARFTFTVERETTMLDWILDWNSNKTQIGDSYLITPKIFVGKKITGDHAKLSDVDGLTGVYIGPNSDDSCGIYGYKAGQDIFHIDEQGGYIGGWVINNNGIATTDGALAINSDGGIVTSSNGTEHYHLYADGHAIFSDGKVIFGNDGSASFEGTIKAKNGTISNWSIDNDMLYTVQIGLNAANKSIAVANVSQIPIASRLFDQAGSFTWLSTHLNWVKQYGGVAMYYTNGSDYGFIAYKGTELSFSAGAANTIAGWNFDGSALWLGTKNNNYAQYAEVGSVTIGTNGLRGSSWYINSSDGTISFVKGWVTFGAEEGKIAGWMLDKDSLWHGTKNDTLHEYTTAAGSMTFGSQGIRGYMWRLDTDGSAGFSGGKAVFDIDGAGHVADGNISWDKDGAVVAAGGSVGWTKDGAGHVADGNISWDNNGNVVFGTDVRAQWEYGIHVAQMIAFGQMLYRDPEFTLTPQTAQFNELEFYPGEFSSYCVIDANNFLTSLNANGLVVRGSFIYLWKLDILDSSDNVISTYELWKNLSDSTQNVTALTAGKVTFVSGNKLKFWLKDKGGGFQIANIATDESGNKSYTWSNVYGYGDNIYTSKDTPGKWGFVDDSTAPNSTKKVLKITSTRWNKATDHRLLGMAFINQSRANAKFVVKIIAKIPVGWKIENYHNQYGNGGKTTWVTSQSGTGDWFEYQCIVECGASGTFNTVNHFALVVDGAAGYVDNVNDGGTAILVSDEKNQVGKNFSTVEWFVAFATVWDATSSEKTWTTIDSHGIYTGTLRADQIVSGQIKSSLINADELLSNGNYWGLKKDGSGLLADGNISWNQDGSGQIAKHKIVWDKDGNIDFSNQVTFYGLKLQKPTYINKSNLMQYVDKKIAESNDYYGYLLKPIKYIGTYLIFENNLLEINGLHWLFIPMPSSNNSGNIQTSIPSEYNPFVIDEARAHIGAKIVFYNMTSYDSSFANNLFVCACGEIRYIKNDGSLHDPLINPAFEGGKFFSAECCIDSINENEQIYWKGKYGKYLTNA